MNMRTGTTLSAMLHIAVVLIAWLGLPSLMKPPIDLEQPMVVEVTTVAKVTNPPPPAAPKVEPKPEPPKPQPEPPKPEPKPEPPKPEPPKPEPPKPTPKPEPPKPEPKPEPPKAEPEPLPEPKPKPEPPKPKAEEQPKFADITPKAKPKPPQDDFDSLLKTVEKLKRQETQPPPPSKEPAPQAAAKPAPNQPTTADAPLTMSERDAIRAQIERCWNVPAGARDAENLVVEVHVLLNPDGSVTRADIVDNPRYSSDGFYRAAAESAVRAVRLCSPLRVPPDKYGEWKSMTLTFNPKDMIYRR